MIEHHTRDGMLWTGATYVSLPVLIDGRGIILTARLTPKQRADVEIRGNQ